MALKTLIILAICKLATSLPEPDLNIKVNTVFNSRDKKQCCDPTTGNCDLKPSDAQYGWTAQQLVMRVSDGNLCRGFFICNDEAKMMKKRWRAIEVSNTIEFSGSSMTDTFFSRDFEDESSSQDFMQCVDNFGTKVSVDANVNYLFVTANAGGSVNYDKKHSKTKQTKSNEKYVSTIKGYNIPTKSADLDPTYIIFTQEVLDELKKIEQNYETEDYKIFLKFFEKYGSHFLTGTIEFGGTLFVEAKSSIKGSSSFEQIKDTVNKAADAYLDISASFIEGSGGVSIKTSAYSLKEHLTSKVEDEDLKSITLDFTKKGGPPGEDSIEKWKKGLVEQTDTWRIIDKSTELIPIWKLILLKPDYQFQDAEKFAGEMETAWRLIIELPDFYIESVDSQTMKQLTVEFQETGISPSSVDKRKQLLKQMAIHGKLGAQKDSRYAHIKLINGGKVVTTALQAQPIDNDPTMLQYDSLLFLTEKPYKVYLKLHHNNLYLGDIIIVLDGPNPKRVQQFLELSTGNNNVGGAWRGSGFNWGIPYLDKPGEWIGCSGYMDANGRQTGVLFPVEDQGTGTTSIVQGQVWGWSGQTSGFTIRTRGRAGENPNTIIGHVISGLDILKVVAARGHDYAMGITFTECGLVVIDE